MKLINVAQAGIISDAPRIPELGLRILEFLLSIFGALALIVLVISGIMYLLAAGDERMIRKAKNALTYAVMGIVITMVSFAIIKTIGLIIGS